MGTLTSALSIALSALSSEKGAMDATANNVANVNTPGYSRVRPVLTESDPVVLAPLTFGTGVSLSKLESLRDPILQLRIGQETQSQGGLDAFVTAMQQVEVNFQSSSGDLGSQLTQFFNSLNQLSTDPVDLSLRQAVLTAAQNLATGFRNTSSNLIRQRSSLDLNVVQDVQQVNTLTGQIAQLNGQIVNLENLQEDASAFIDQRDVLIQQLSSLIDVSSIKSSNGLTLTTSNGTALVAGEENFNLSTQTDAAGVQHVFSNQTDITARLSSGALAGTIAVRDNKIPGVLSQLDSLASAFATAVNNVHRAGFDLNGNAGGDLFAAPPAGGQGAAAALTVAITDPQLVAASSDGSPDSNGNVLQLAALHDQPLVSGQAANEFYGNIIFAVGSDVANGSSDLDASKLILQKLQDQRGSISGVSLDEEAANMILFQRAYDASARIVQTVSEMLDTVIQMGTS
jgi:flagellar hook-associated protein 1